MHIHFIFAVKMQRISIIAKKAVRLLLSSFFCDPASVLNNDCSRERENVLMVFLIGFYLVSFIGFDLLVAV